MNTIIDNTSKKLAKNIFYNILGGYAKGAASEVALSKHITPRILGERICNYKRAAGEGYLPFDESKKIIVSNERENLHYLHTLADYGTGLLYETAYKLNNKESLSESVKLNLLKNKAVEISRHLGRYAYAEGMVDEELKRNIQIILNEGKEQFIKRTKESERQEPIESADISNPDGMEDMQGDQQMDDMMGGEFGDGGDFGTFDDGQEFSNKDLGFDDGFGSAFDEQEDQDNKEPQEDQALLDAGKQMEQFNDGLVQKAESLTSNELSKIITQRGYSESNINDLLTEINHNRILEPSLYHLGNNVISTMSKKALQESVDELLKFEEELFTSYASAESANGMDLDEYEMVVPYSINEMATILAVRNAFNI